MSAVNKCIKMIYICKTVFNIFFRFNMGNTDTCKENGEDVIDNIY